MSIFCRFRLSIRKPFKESFNDHPSIHKTKFPINFLAGHNLFLCPFLTYSPSWLNSRSVFSKGKRDHLQTSNCSQNLRPNFLYLHHRRFNWSISGGKVFRLPLSGVALAFVKQWMMSVGRGKQFALQNVKEAIPIFPFLILLLSSQYAGVY